MRKAVFTKEEEEAIRKRVQPRCPGTKRMKSGRIIECGSYQTGYSGGFLAKGFKVCYRCGHEWGWVNKRNQPVTKAEYAALVERDANRWRDDSKPLWLTPPLYEDPKGDGDMASKKKAKKGSKSRKSRTVSGKGAAAKRVAVKDLSPEERSKRSGIARTAFLMHTTTKTNEQIQAQILKEFRDASKGHRDGRYQKVIRSRLHNGAKEYAWLKCLPHKGDSYFGHKPAKATKVAKVGQRAGKAKKKKAKKSSRVVA